MQTFKTIVVVGTLLCVGWGAHVVLNKPISNRPLDLKSTVWDELPADPPQVDTEPEVPDVLVPDLPPLQTVQAPREPTGLPVASPSENALTPLPVPNESTMPPLSSGIAQTNPAIATPVTPLTTPGSLVPVPPAGTQLANPAPYPVQNAGAEPTSGAEGPYAMTTSAEEPEYASTWSDKFEEMWDSVQMKLQSSQFVDALLALSLFYNDEGVTGEQRARMITLLDQLAGTVIYSADYHMVPAHIVQPGETLASIAAAYSVPEPLLARINNVSSSVEPGAQLKVLRGPFRGELNVQTRELTLFLGHHYAGRFTVGIGRDLPLQVSTLQVTAKEGSRPYVDRRTGQEFTAGSAENPYGQYWIGLQDQGMPADPLLGIHSMGTAVDASDTRGCISVGEQDANDLQAILSPGSKITVMR